MLNRRAVPLLILSLVTVAFIQTGCRPVTISFRLYTPTPAPTPPVVHAFTQFSPGDTLDLVQTQLGLDDYEVRYRSSMPEGEMGMVYFLKEGNLHVDAKKIGSTWVILSVPLLEPSALSAGDRAAAWDRAADPQKIPTKSQM